MMQYKLGGEVGGVWCDNVGRGKWEGFSVM